MHDLIHFRQSTRALERRRTIYAIGFTLYLQEKTMLKIGYKASAEQFAPRDLLDFSRLAEQYGFDSVFISDHFQPWRHTGGHAPFSLTWLGGLAARTTRIQSCTPLLTTLFPHDPTVVAQAFATLAVMFPNRVVLGLGS